MSQLFQKKELRLLTTPEWDRSSLKDRIIWNRRLQLHDTSEDAGRLFTDDQLLSRYDPHIAVPEQFRFSTNPYWMMPSMPTSTPIPPAAPAAETIQTPRKLSFNEAFSGEDWENVDDNTAAAIAFIRDILWPKLPADICQDLSSHPLRKYLKLEKTTTQPSNNIVVKNMKKANVRSLHARSLAVISRAYFGHENLFDSNLDYRKIMDNWPEGADIPLGPAPGVELQSVRQNMKGKQPKNQTGQSHANKRSMKELSPMVEQQSENGQHDTQSVTELRRVVSPDVTESSAQQDGQQASNNIRKRPAEENIEQPRLKRLDKMQEQVVDVLKSITDLTARSDRQEKSLEQLRQQQRGFQEKLDNRDRQLTEQLDKLRAHITGQLEDLSKIVQCQGQNNEQLCRQQHSFQEKLDDCDRQLIEQLDRVHSLASNMQTQQIEMLRQLDELRHSLTARPSCII
ncbi:hypothetical protein H634G_03088 [Metarhizium anisopliae BRIP 53293]|uniref:Uncharacterized protein n=1 Tax=Metarhizium anisopliae BRIP 53293 TaxID=1291518 RepID=A0A0D9PAJ1_METAN|nr:hypothetical protein H634G_03088 [Metarhizium anisopliae BRIP 53293]KJK95083.1 hypothetical protein H633G_01001 [Metarhizium anisopliae BRIP 53284]